MAQNTIPVISNIPQLAQWQSALRQTLKIPTAPSIPANLAAASKQGGNYLTWSAVTGADGYQIEVSENGDFATVLNTVLLPGQQSTAFFDTVPTSAGAAPATRYYRVRATAGTVRSPQTVKGRTSSTVSSTAIAPNDTVTASTTTRDLSNYDSLNASSSIGDYRVLPG